MSFKRLLCLIVILCLLFTLPLPASARVGRGGFLRANENLTVNVSTAAPEGIPVVPEPVSFQEQSVGKDEKPQGVPATSTPEPVSPKDGSTEDNEKSQEIPVAAAGVVGGEDAVGHGALGGIRHSGGIKALRGQCRRGVCICVDPCAAHIVRAARAAFDGFQHIPSPLSIRPEHFPPFPADALEPEPLHRGPALPVLLSRTAYRGWR